MDSLRKSWSSASNVEVRHFGFMCFWVVNMLFFDYRLLLARRWKLVELFMTVMMYWSQWHGRRGQRIDTRKPESGIVLIYMGVIKLVAFSLGKRIWCFSLAFSPCAVQGKLMFLLNFGFTVSLNTHIEILPVLESDGSSKFVSWF